MKKDILLLASVALLGLTPATSLIAQESSSSESVTSSSVEKESASSESVASSSVETESAASSTESSSAASVEEEWEEEERVNGYVPFEDWIFGNIELLEIPSKNHGLLNRDVLFNVELRYLGDAQADGITIPAPTVRNSWTTLGFTQKVVFTKPGTYEFVLVQKPREGQESKFKVDTTEKKITITVTADEEGYLKGNGYSSTDQYGKGIVFKNTYIPQTPKAESTSSMTESKTSESTSSTTESKTSESASSMTESKDSESASSMTESKDSENQLPEPIVPGTSASEDKGTESTSESKASESESTSQTETETKPSVEKKTTTEKKAEPKKEQKTLPKTGETASFAVLGLGVLAAGVAFLFAKRSKKA